MFEVLWLVRAGYLTHERVRISFVERTSGENELCMQPLTLKNQNDESHASNSALIVHARSGRALPTSLRACSRVCPRSGALHERLSMQLFRKYAARASTALEVHG